MDVELTIASRYQVLRWLGGGVAGRVLAARDVRLGREVAVKLLNRDLAQDAEGRARFLREARVAAAIGHPAAVDVYDFGLHEGQPYLVMEYLDGRTVRDTLADAGRMPAAAVVAIGASVAEALAAAHGRGLVHRDVKPANVMMSGDQRAPGRVTVLDFGLAFSVEAESGMGRQTRAGVLAGTPAYMSPEQARGDTVGPRADVYSLACMLYEMVAGEPPFAGEIGQVLTSQMYLPPARLSERMGPAAGVAAIDDLTARMLSKRAEDRPSAAAVAAELRGMEIGAPRPARRTAPSTRADRMVDAAVVAPDPDVSVRIVVDDRCDVPRSLLRVCGITVVAASDAHDVVLAAVDGPGDVEPWRDLPGALIACIAPDQLGAAADLIRDGVYDVYVRDHPATELIDKIKRAARRSKRALGG